MSSDSEVQERTNREKSHYDSAEFQQAVDRSYRRFFNHERAVVYPFLKKRFYEAMKPYEGGDFLEIGSYSWMTFVISNRLSPGSITCVNISQAEIDKGIVRAKKSHVRPEFVLMDAHKMSFEHKFDVIFGSGILHHLDLEIALTNVSRHLKDSGVAVFFEPLDINPVSSLIRKLTPSARTPDERPFKRNEIRMLSNNFDCQFYATGLTTIPMQFLSALLFRNGDNKFMRAVFSADQYLLKLFPALWVYYRDFVVVMKKG